MSPVNIRKRW